MNFYELFQFLSSNVWIYGGTFLLVLSILVFVHEWGHYIVARLCGVRVETFSIGFGKEIGGFTDKHGTRWKFSMIPLGGYVKLFGDVDPASVKHTENVEDSQTGAARPLTASERGEAFFAKPVWKRAAVVIAGPAINYIFAIIVLAGLYIFQGQPVTPPEAAAIIQGSSAEEYEFKPHDLILSIDGRKIDSFEDIRREMMIALDGKKNFEIERDGKIINIMASPKKVEMEDRFGFKQSRGLLGLISPRHAVRIEDIKEINGRAFDNPDNIRKELVRRLGTEFRIVVDRGSSDDILTVKPLKDLNTALLQKPEQNAATGDEESAELLVTDRDLLFIASRKGDVFVLYNPFDALLQAVKETAHITVGTLEAIGQMITGMRSATELGGIIRIGALAGDMAQQGLVAVILFTALLSINLGLINLFPIPLLDGGHLVFYAFEAILGRPIPDQIQEYAFRIGLAFLVGIMVFANLNDIMQLIL